jgi:hypothetical protein
MLSSKNAKIEEDGQEENVALFGDFGALRQDLGPVYCGDDVFS